jgi:hypothetical protein
MNAKFSPTFRRLKAVVSIDAALTKQNVPTGNGTAASMGVQAPCMLQFAAFYQEKFSVSSY